jgi:glycosyltransferase involved in cell wall biosynthesis
MKRIALIVDDYPSNGGIAQYNQALVEAFDNLPDELFQKTILYTNEFWEEYLTPYKLIHTRIDLPARVKKMLKALALLRLPFFIRKTLFSWMAPALAKKLNKKNFDLLILASQDPLSLFIDVPRINAIHDLMHRYERRFPEASGNGRYRYREILFKAFCDESELIMVDSKVGKEQVIESYQVSPEKVFDLPYIPPPHIIESIVPADFNERYKDLPRDFLFFPGQFWKHKNHINLIHALHILKEKGTNITLAFAGKKRYEYPVILHEIEKYGLQENVVFLDFVPNEYIKEIYARARGLVMPTFFGPTNIPPLEAIFSGCPPAVSGIYGMFEQLGKAALYFDPKDPESIAETMLALWEDENKRAELKKNGIIKMNTWNSRLFNERFNEIIKSIA